MKSANRKFSILTVWVFLVTALFVGVGPASADSDDFTRVGAGLPYNGSYQLTNFWNCNKRGFVGKFAGFGGTGNNVNQSGAVVNSPSGAVTVLTPGQSTTYTGLALNFSGSGDVLTITVMAPNPSSDINLSGLNIWIQCNKKDENITSPHYYRTTITDLLISKDPNYKAPDPVFEPGAVSVQINFDSTTNGGSAVTPPSRVVEIGDAVLFPVPSDRNGYDFLGWYSSPSGGVKVSAPYPVTSTQTLYARWQAQSRVVNFDSNGGGANPAPVTCVTGTTSPALPGAPTREGFSFLGWFTSATGGSKVTDSCTGPATLFAQWEQIVVPAVAPTSLGAVVYFGYNLRTLDATARATIDSLVAQLPSDKKNVKIRLVGWAQSGKSLKYDSSLSKDRAKVVADYLRSLGVNATFSISGKGWDRDDAKSRRTEIYVTLN